MGGGNAREVALLSLAACEGQGAWSDGYLKRAVSRAGLDRRDAALAARLCYGVLQNRMLCDFWIDRFSSVKAARLEVRVACALRLALYQLAFLDKIPASAAVNESVSLARKYARNPRAAGLVNGVLRAFLRAEERPMPRDLATRYSHPAWLVEELRRALRDQGVEELLAADNGQPPTTVQVNPLKASPEETLERLRDAGVKAEAHPWLPGCLLLSGTGNLEELAPFQEGWFTVQDAAARLAVLAAVVDCVLWLLSPNRGSVLPYTAAAGLALCFAQWGISRESRGSYDSFRMASLDDDPPYLVTETGSAITFGGVRILV